MYNDPEASVVRIFTANGVVVGTGFLVGEDTILTCAHVIAAALEISENTLTIPEMHVCLDFPLVASGYTLTAQIIFWQPVQVNGSGDIAVLRLEHTPPNGTETARLVFTEDLWDHTFRTFGFPDRHDQGVWASGRLRAREATGWIQIEDVGGPIRVRGGFSGAAVWDNQLDGVVGMVVAVEKDMTASVAYMIPTDTLVQAWPLLRQQMIPSCPYRGLYAFREQDAPYFFGREAFIQQLVDAVRRKPLFAIVGPSGSGKSSVVFAGLVPRLRQEGTWLITSFRPGDRPFHSLAAALMPFLEPQRSETDRLIEINKLAQHLQQGELPLQDVIKTIKQKLISTHLLLIADQFEELYTLCRETEIRQQFLDELLTAIRATSTQDESKCTTEVASVRVWETIGAQDVIVLEHNAGVDLIRFSPDGLYIVTISRNRHYGMSDTAEVWETATGVRQIYLEQKKNASSIAFSPDGHLLATGNKFRGAEIWETEEGTLVANLHHRAGVNAMAFSPDGKYLATASSDNTTKIWDVASAQELTVLEHENEVRFVVFSPDGHYIVTVTGDETGFTAVEDKQATIWDVPSGHPVVKLVHNKKIKALAFSPDGHLLATASADNTARIWEVPSGRTLLELPHKKEINAITFSPNGYYIATASNDKTA